MTILTKQKVSMIVRIAVSLLVPFGSVDAALGSDAQCISVNVMPKTMSTGQKFTGMVNMKNTGTTPWLAGGKFFLGAQNPQDNTSWGVGRVPLPVTAVTSGQVARFTFKGTAPSIPGTYAFSWQMVQEGSAWFGGLCSAPSTVTVVAAPNLATTGQFTVPKTQSAGQQVPITINMKNTGLGTWVASNPAPYQLETWYTFAGVKSGIQKTTISANVAPGQNATFRVNAIAPNPVNAGTKYQFSWRMIQGGKYFGATGVMNVGVNRVATPTPTAVPVTPTPFPPTPTPIVTPLNPYDGYSQNVTTPTPNPYDAYNQGPRPTRDPSAEVFAIELTWPVGGSKVVQGELVPVMLQLLWGRQDPAICGTWELVKPNGETITLTSSNWENGKAPVAHASCTNGAY